MQRDVQAREARAVLVPHHRRVRRVKAARDAQDREARAMLGHRHHRRVRQVNAAIDVQAREARAVLGHRHHRRVRQVKALFDIELVRLAPLALIWAMKASSVMVVSAFQCVAPMRFFMGLLFGAG